MPTLDTHRALQIFHPSSSSIADGRHPEPYTVVTLEDVDAGRWRVDQRWPRSSASTPSTRSRILRYYVETLATGGKYALTIWPFHAMRAGIGHALVSAIEEAVFFHSIARTSQPDVQRKGDNPLTEHYSVLGPEVDTDLEGEPLGRRNQELIERLLRFDAVVIAGQAKSHCVAWTISDLLDDPTVRERGLARKVYLLEDCTSPVVVPGVADYTEEADAAFARFAEAGAHVVRSTDPIASWPGVLAAASNSAIGSRGRPCLARSAQPRPGWGSNHPPPAVSVSPQAAPICADSVPALRRPRASARRARAAGSAGSDARPSP